MEKFSKALGITIHYLLIVRDSLLLAKEEAPHSPHMVTSHGDAGMFGSFNQAFNQAVGALNNGV